MLPFHVIIFSVLVVGWHATVKVLDVSPTVIPSPLSVWNSLRHSVADGILIPHTIITLQEILYGVLVGAAVGVLIGVVIAEVAWIRRLFYPYVVALQAMPKVALAPLFLIWFGFGMLSKVLLTVTMVFFPVAINTIQGLNSPEKGQIDLMRAFCASRWQIFIRVRIPNAVPYIFAGLEIAVVLGVIGAIVAEFISATTGLGYLILQQNLTLNMAGVFAVLIVLAVIGVLLSALIKAIHRRVVYWREVDRTV